MALFAVLAIAVVAAGCGGGGSSSSSGSTGDTTGGSTESSESGSTSESSSGGPAPSKAAFIKEADTICSKADAKLTEEISKYAEENSISTEKEPTKDQQEEILEAVVFPNISMQAEELEALTPPEGEEEKVEEITSTLTEEVAEAEEDPGDVSEGTLEGATKKAQAYGLKTCGS